MGSALNARIRPGTLGHIPQTGRPSNPARTAWVLDGRPPARAAPAGLHGALHAPRSGTTPEQAGGRATDRVVPHHVQLGHGPLMERTIENTGATGRQQGHRLNPHPAYLAAAAD